MMFKPWRSSLKWCAWAGVVSLDFKWRSEAGRLDHQPLFWKGARALPPKAPKAEGSSSRGGTRTRHERAAEIEPTKLAETLDLEKVWREIFARRLDISKEMCSCLDCNNHYSSLPCPDVTQNNLRYRLYFSIRTSRSELTDLVVIEIDSTFALTADDFFFRWKGKGIELFDTIDNWYFNMRNLTIIGRS